MHDETIDEDGAENPCAFPSMPPLGADDMIPQGFPLPEMGMTLRDWFAGQALSGLIASTTRATAEEFASGAYMIADAMLRERSK